MTPVEWVPLQTLPPAGPNLQASTLSAVAWASTAAATAEVLRPQVARSQRVKLPAAVAEVKVLIPDLLEAVLALHRMHLQAAQTSQASVPCVVVQQPLRVDQPQEPDEQPQQEA